MNVLERIDEYLQLGGLFNPELANHQAVRNLIIDCRDHIRKIQLDNDIKKVLEDKVTKVQTVKCKVTDPYVERVPAGDFTWYVYNKRSGHIVASTYDRKMAEAILEGIEDNNLHFKDPYGICEKYRGPEPMV